MISYKNSLNYYKLKFYEFYPDSVISNSNFKESGFLLIKFGLMDIDLKTSIFSLF